MPDISSLNGGIPKPTPSLTDKLPVQEVGGVTVSVTVASLIALASSGGGGSGGGGTGLSAWQLKTANYTAIAGDRLRIDCSTGDVTITLPPSPTAEQSDIWIQRIDSSANSLKIDPGLNNFKNLSNRIGLLDNGNIGLVEIVSYANATIGYLTQHDRLTYQTGSLTYTYNSAAFVNTEPVPKGIVWLLGTSNNTTAFVSPMTAKMAGRFEAGSTPNGFDRSLASPASPQVLYAWDFISNNVRVGQIGIYVDSAAVNQITLWGSNSLSGFDNTTVNSDANWTDIGTISNLSASTWNLLSATDTTTYWRYLRIKAASAIINLQEIEFYDSSIVTPSLNLV